ncbi:MAG: S24/S26 family peptidase [Alistipes sp.]|nr:S24/S26 family peptidase [Alistipes sp.]
MKISNELFFEQIELLLKEGTDATFTLRGNSMRPLLRNNRDQVVVTPIGHEDPRVGEVYLFRYQGHHLLHRLHRIEHQTLVMRGDGNHLLEERCQTKDLVARLVYIKRPSGKTINCASKSWQLKSKIWCTIPAWTRRIILGIMRRIRP